MKAATKIGLTQRVQLIPDYGERRDCLDQRWTRLLERAGFTAVPLANLTSEVDACVDALGFGGVILTGGNDIAQLVGARDPAPERDRFERALVSACRERGLPVLGVCRGMQLLNLYHGGHLVPVGGHVAVRHEVSWRSERQPIEVNSYHGHGVVEASLGEGLEIVALAADQTVEALCHRADQLLGLMWHPERESPFVERDVELLRAHFGAVGRATETIEATKGGTP